ncbi:MAG TPA: hypothetical protein VNI61_10975 [Gemmatimonadales bacterium]|nr:hypothetical protein [Gemmatimonadales bacterium]
MPRTLLPVGNPWRPVLVGLGALAAACAGDASRGPACGMALTFGPTLIQQQLLNPRAVIVDAPVGLPGTLPARLADRVEPGSVIVGYEGGQLVMGYQGTGFPTRPGYALLVVDDTSQRAMGVVIYDRDGPTEHPRIGTVQGGSTTIPLYGVLVDWASVSNPRCPLLGSPAAPDTV